MTVRGRMRRATLGLLLGLAVATLTLSSVAATDCEIVLGFKTLRDLVGQEIVGECTENAQYNAAGDATQNTTGGLLVWSKADNITSFTDGHHTWINGPNGLQKRLNTERFPWEKDYVPEGSTPPLPLEQDTEGVEPATEAESLPLPPAPWVSIIPSIIEANYYASSNREVWSIDADFLWPDSVTKIEYIFRRGRGEIHLDRGKFVYQERCSVST